MTLSRLRSLKPIFPSGSKLFRHLGIHLLLPKTANQPEYCCQLRIMMNWCTGNLFLILLRRGLRMLKAGEPKRLTNYEKLYIPEEIRVIDDRDMIRSEEHTSDLQSPCNL